MSGLRYKPLAPSYMLVDNRHSGGKREEFDWKKCAHCQTQVILNPLRTREHDKCRKCMRFICEKATCHLECQPIDQIIEAAYDAAAKGQPLTLPRRFLTG